MPDSNATSVELGSLFAGSGRKVVVKLWKNDAHPSNATRLQDLQWADTPPADSRTGIVWDGPVANGTGTARIESQEFTFTRTSPGNTPEVARGYALIEQQTSPPAERLLTAERFEEPLTFGSQGQSIGLVFDVAGLKDPTPNTDRLVLQARVRVVRGGSKLPHVLRAQLIRLRTLLAEILAREANDLERSDRTGKGYVPFIPAADVDDAAHVILTRCNGLLSRPISD